MNAITLSLLMLFSIDVFCQDSLGVEFICRLNEYRGQNGLKPVDYSCILDSACRIHSEWMWKYNTLSHEEYGPANINLARYSRQQRIWEFDPVRQFETIYSRENVCRTTMERGKMFGYTGPSKEIFDEVFKCWVHSPGHRDALLSKNVTHAAFSIVALCDSATGEFRAYSTCLLAQKLK